MPRKMVDAPSVYLGLGLEIGYQGAARYPKNQIASLAAMNAGRYVQALFHGAPRALRGTDIALQWDAAHRALDYIEGMAEVVAE